METTTKTLTEAEITQMVRLKSYFPYRLIFGCKHPETGEFFPMASTDRRKSNGFLRKGWIVHELT